MQKLNHSIFFAATAFHLMCIYELHKKDPERNFELILLLGGDQFANGQLYKTLKILGFRNYTTFQFHKNLILRYLTGLMLIAKLFKRFNSVNLTITIIDFRNSFMHSFRCFFKNATFILIDDGFNTYVSYEKYLKNNMYLPVDNYRGIRNSIIKWLYFGTRYKDLQKENIELFSIYFDYFDFNKVTGSKNHLSSCKDILQLATPLQSNQNVFFIGTKNSERGAMTLEDELFYIEWLNKYWKLKGKTLFYIAKRSTSNSKIALIKKLKIKCLRFDLPLELALINNESIPGIVCSTGSTLLKTLPMLYDSIEYYLVDISSFFIHKSDEEIFNFSKIFCAKHQIKTLIIKR
jgi:hypothetical protein